MSTPSTLTVVRIFGLPVSLDVPRIQELLNPLIAIGSSSEIEDEALKSAVARATLKIANAAHRAVVFNLTGSPLNISAEIRCYDLMVAAFAIQKCHTESADLELAKKLYVDAMLVALYGVGAVFSVNMSSIASADRSAVIKFILRSDSMKIRGKSGFSFLDAIADKEPDAGMAEDEKIPFLREMLSGEGLLKIKAGLKVAEENQLFLKQDASLGLPIRTLSDCLTIYDEGLFSL
jgi:hypothetical protein